jgi:glucuronate isomerase
LRRIFGIEDVAISEKTADKIWEEGNARLQELDTWALLKQAKVEIACTTDDPADDLAQHRELAGTELETRILPAFRPDKAIRIADPAFTDYLGKLGAAAGIGITSFAALAEALVRRVKFFHENGSRISDHALDKPLPAKVATAAEVEAIFAKRLKGEPLSDAEQGQHALAVLVEVGRAYHAHDWAMCFHIGAQRNNSSRKLKTMGPDVGADSASDIAAHSPGVATLLDRLDSTDQLPRTMLFGIDGQMNLWLSTLTGCFQDGKVVGKLQFGPAWWFNDHKEGNLRQMIDLANNGLLGTFVGMVTDSRSFASYPRHDYFRRLLCRLMGGWVDEGEYPDDAELLGTLIRGVCYENAKAYFRF